MKTFKGDFDKFLDKIKRGRHFSLSRWGDGELKILEGGYIDLRTKGNGEFRYDPAVPEYQKSRYDMIDAYKYVDEEYYIGVACPCCVGQEKYEYMKRLSGQCEENLTWANIFVNSNYGQFKEKYMPEFTKHIVNLVINKNSKLEALPFASKNTWYVGTDAWLDDYHLIDTMAEYIIRGNVRDEIFIIAAGPFANILTHKLWLVSKENTYIDIGSVLDPYLGLKLTRGYHLGAKTLEKTCIW